MDAVDELIRILDREAVVGEQILFRLKSLELLLAADEHRFVATASQELEEGLNRLGTLEAMRALAAAEVADALGVEPGSLTISGTLRLADDRQRAQLLAAQVRLRALLADLDAQAALDRDLALAGIARVRALLERAGAAPGIRYGQDGIVPGTRPSRSFDERL